MPKETAKPVDYSKPLKNRQYEAFCQFVYSGESATSAATKAKYSEKTARTKGSQLMTIIDIKKRVAFLQNEVARSLKITVEGVLDDIVNTHGRAKGEDNYKAELKASDMLMKHLGAYEKDNKISLDKGTLTLLGLIDGSNKGQLPDRSEIENAR